MNFNLNVTAIPLSNNDVTLTRKGEIKRLTIKNNMINWWKLICKMHKTLNFNSKINIIP